MFITGERRPNETQYRLGRHTGRSYLRNGLKVLYPIHPPPPPHPQVNHRKESGFYSPLLSTVDDLISYGMTIQMKPFQQHFHMVLFIPYIVLTFVSVEIDL